MTVFQIVSEFCDRTEVDIRAIVGRCRKEGIVWERFAAMSACLACGFKSEEIARFFKRDRTSVLYARQAWRSLVYANSGNKTSKSRRITELNKAAIETAECFNELEEEE